MSSTLLNLAISFPSQTYPYSEPTAGIRFHSRARHGHLLSRFCDFGFDGISEISIKRCRFVPMATSMELPLLPFSPKQAILMQGVNCLAIFSPIIREFKAFILMSLVLVPSESRTLHLYEARYLALLEEASTRKSNFFVHFVLDPIIIGNSSSEPSFAASYGCLVVIENVERLDVGALVSIRGIGRTKILKFLQADPYLKGLVIPEQDIVPESLSRFTSKITEVKEALQSLNSLEIKLKAPKDALLQTHTANSLAWAEKEPLLDCDPAFIPPLSERLSFAGFQPVSGSTDSELLKLQNKKLRAMELKDTLQRLDESLELNRENISMVAAKVAIQSLEMQ